MRGSHWLHVMWQQRSLGDAVIGNICCHFGCGTESGGRVGPSHGQGQRHSNELGLIIIMGHGDC